MHAVGTMRNRAFIATALIAAVASAQLLPGAQWPILGGGLERRSQAMVAAAAGALPRNGFKSAWLFQQDAGLTLQQGPVASADSIFVTASGTSSNPPSFVISVDANTGTQRWQTLLPQVDSFPIGLPTSLTLGAQAIFVGTSGFVVALSYSGSIMWVTPVCRSRYPTSMSPVVSGSMVIASCDITGPLTAVNAATGAILWQNASMYPARNSPAALLPATSGSAPVMLFGADPSVGPSVLAAVDTASGYAIPSFTMTPFASGALSARVSLSNDGASAIFAEDSPFEANLLLVDASSGMVRKERCRLLRVSLVVS